MFKRAPLHPSTPPGPLVPWDALPPLSNLVPHQPHWFPQPSQHGERASPPDRGIRIPAEEEEAEPRAPGLSAAGVRQSQGRDGDQQPAGGWMRSARR